MGFIRGLLAVIVGTLLFVSILAGVLLLTVSSSLKYENIKENLAPIAKEALGQVEFTNQLQSMSSVMKSYCSKNSEYIFKYQNYSLAFPCEIVLQGTDATINYGIEKTIEGIYYREYDCDFLNCFAKGEIPLFLISQKAEDFWTSKFYLSLLISILLAVLMFFIVKKKTGFPIILGSFFVVVSLAILGIGKLISKFFDNATGNLVGLFFSASYSLFIKMLIAGIVLIITGIILKIMGVGIKVSKFVSGIKEKNQKAEEKRKPIKKPKKKKSK